MSSRGSIFGVCSAASRNRKFNPRVGQKGTAPTSATRVSVSTNALMECLQMCQEGTIVDGCLSVNYDSTSDTCELMSAHAETTAPTSGWSYWDLVSGMLVSKIYVNEHYSMIYL